MELVSILLDKERTMGKYSRSSAIDGAVICLYLQRVQNGCTRATSINFLSKNYLLKKVSFKVKSKDTPLLSFSTET